MTDTTNTNETVTTATTPNPTTTAETTPTNTDTTSQTTTKEESKGSSEPENILDSLKKEAGKKDETSTPEHKKDDTTTSDKEVDKSKTTPTEIEYELELPKDSQLTEKDIEEVAKLAEKYKLSKEEAEGLISEREALVKRGHEALMAKAHEVVKAEKEKIAKDPDFQGEKLAETLDNIDLAINKYGDENLKAYLRGPGGNNLGVLKFLSRIGSLGASDKMHGKGGTASDMDNSEEARMARLYPSQFAKK